MRTLTIKLQDFKNYFSFSFYFGLNSMYSFFNPEEKSEFTNAEEEKEELFFKCFDDHTVKEIWVKSYQKYPLEKNENIVFECVYDSATSKIDSNALNEYIKKEIPKRVFDWYLSDYKKLESKKTLTITPDEWKKHFAHVYPYNIVSEYFNIPYDVFCSSAFNFSKDNTILNAWVSTQDPGDNPSLDENGCITWICLYDFIENTVDAEDFNNYMKKYSDEMKCW